MSTDSVSNLEKTQDITLSVRLTPAQLKSVISGHLVLISHVSEDKTDVSIVICTKGIPHGIPPLTEPLPVMAKGKPKPVKAEAPKESQEVREKRLRDVSVTKRLERIGSWNDNLESSLKGLDPEVLKHIQLSSSRWKEYAMKCELHGYEDASASRLASLKTDPDHLLKKEQKASKENPFSGIATIEEGDLEETAESSRSDAEEPVVADGNVGPSVRHRPEEETSKDVKIEEAEAKKTVPKEAKDINYPVIKETPTSEEVVDLTSIAARAEKNTRKFRDKSKGSEENLTVKPQAPDPGGNSRKAKPSPRNNNRGGRSKGRGSSGGSRRKNNYNRP